MSVNLPEIEVLIDRIKCGDQQAFSEVYDRYCGALNGVVQRNSDHKPPKKPAGRHT